MRSDASEVRTPALVKRGFQSPNDRALDGCIRGLKNSRNALAHNNEVIRIALDLPTDRTKSFLARALHCITPKRLYPSLPNAVVQFIAEEFDVLAQFEGLIRTNLNNTQEALRDIAACAIAKSEDLHNLTMDVEGAIEEDWDAQRLQEYMAQRVNIPIYAEVSKLLDREFSLLNPEEKEARKVQLLRQLQENIIIGEELIRTMSKICSAGLEIFHRGVGQYFDYMNVQRPIAIIRDAARGMVELNSSMIGAKDAIRETFRTSLQAIEAAVDAATLVERYRISSPDIENMLIAGQKQILAKLKVMQTAGQRLALPDPTKREKPQDDPQPIAN